MLRTSETGVDQTTLITSILVLYEDGITCKNPSGRSKERERFLLLKRGSSESVNMKVASQFLGTVETSKILSLESGNQLPHLEMPAATK